MKVNSDKSMEVAAKAFERHGGSWTKMRENGRRINGVLVIGGKMPAPTPQKAG